MHGTFREQAELAKNRLILWLKNCFESPERKKNCRASKFARCVAIDARWITYSGFIRSVLLDRF
jgi:hypothetical protein